MADRKSHWEGVYQSKRGDEVSWFQPHLALSLEYIRQSGIPDDAPVIDVGGGASTLVDDLLREGYTDVTLLDVAEHALDQSRRRLGELSRHVHWLSGDVTSLELPKARFALWHDRAVFHFLTREEERELYRGAMLGALRANGCVVLATFGPGGPEKCSGLDVVRYAPEALGEFLGQEFTLISSRVEHHRTPTGAVQEFVYGLFRRRPPV
jgi:SAM-dependent methyltransferase